VLTALLDTAADWPVAVVLAVAGALLVVESGTLIGIALPGTTLLVGLGMWSLTAPHALVPAVVVSAVATVTGAHVGWWRGRRGSAIGRAPRWLRRSADAHAARASRWLAERRWPATVLLLGCGHWAAAARPVLPRTAGAAGVPYRVAGPALIVSGSAWAATLVLLGNRVGALVLTSAVWVPIVLVALLVAALVVRSRLRGRARADEEPLIPASSRRRPTPPA
jgi:membrane-associated protein